SFSPKSHGLLVLTDVLREDPVHLWLLISSLSAVLGGLGFSAYAAANSYMEAFAAARRRERRARWLTVGLDACDFEPGPPSTALRAQDVIRAVDRLLRNRHLHVDVTKTDLHARIRRWATPLESFSNDPLAVDDAVADQRMPTNGSPNDPESVISAMVRDLLGVAEVAPDADFFAD